MRLFYTILFICTIISFAGCASQNKHQFVQIQVKQTTAIVNKNIIKLTADFDDTNESLKTDLVRNTFFKINTNSLLVVFYGLSIPFFPIKVNSCNAIKRLKFSYCGLLKMLYAKHFFW